VKFVSNIYSHGFPFAPSGGDFARTDMIYVESAQTANRDSYSSYAGRVNGPQVFSLDYSSLIPIGNGIDTLTIGIGADDFQSPTFGQSFWRSIAR